MQLGRDPSGQHPEVASSGLEHPLDSADLEASHLASVFVRDTAASTAHPADPAADAAGTSPEQPPSGVTAFIQPASGHIKGKAEAAAAPPALLAVEVAEERQDRAALHAPAAAVILEPAEAAGDWFIRYGPCLILQFSLLDTADGRLPEAACRAGDAAHEGTTRRRRLTSGQLFLLLLLLLLLGVLGASVALGGRLSGRKPHAPPPQGAAFQSVSWSVSSVAGGGSLCCQPTSWRQRLRCAVL
jgi:hypothetical protein